MGAMRTGVAKAVPSVAVPTGLRPRLASKLAPQQPAVIRQSRQLAVKATANAAGAGLPIDLRGKKAFIAGVADDQVRAGPIDGQCACQEGGAGHDRMLTAWLHASLLPAPLCLGWPQPEVLWVQGFGWAIAKCLAEAGAEISLGVWVSAGACQLSGPCCPSWAASLGPHLALQTLGQGSPQTQRAHSQPLRSALCPPYPHFLPPWPPPPRCPR